MIDLPDFMIHRHPATPRPPAYRVRESLRWLFDNPSVPVPFDWSRAFARALNGSQPMPVKQLLAARMLPWAAQLGCVPSAEMLTTALMFGSVGSADPTAFMAWL